MGYAPRWAGGGLIGFDDYARAREQAAGILRDLSDVAAPSLPEEAARLAALADRAREGRFKILLLGCFSTGKSTLLNALLGHPVLPARLNPCTAILTEVRHGEQPGVELRYRDGRREEADLQTFLRDWQLATTDSRSDLSGELDRFTDMERAVVRWPLPLLAHGVALVDSPGLDDDPARTRRTLGELPEADAVIAVLAAPRFLTNLERKTLYQDLRPLGLTNLFFAVTMVDLLAELSDDPARERAALEERARTGLGPLTTVDGVDRYAERVFLVDARAGLAARWDRKAGIARDDREGREASGITAFEATLERFLVHQRGRAHLARLAGAARRVGDEIERSAALDRATAAASVDELRSRAEELGPRFDALSAIADRVDRIATRFVERQQVAVWQDLRAFLARVEGELPDAVAQFDLGGLAALDLLTARGRARVEAALRTRLDSWLGERIAAWQASVRPQIEAALGVLRDELAADAAAFDALAKRIAADFARGTIRVAPGPDVADREVDPVERWFSVAVGALLLSPGTIAAGWSDGYEGALKGAAGRIGVRLAVLGLGALLGPVGWAGLLLYAVTDAVLLYLTGGGQLKRLRDQVADRVRGTLVAQADAARPAIEAQVAAGLAPLRDGLVAAARSEADALQRLLERTITTRELAVADARGREIAWNDASSRFRAALPVLDGLVASLSDAP